MFYWSDKTSYVKTREWNQITQHHRKNRWNHDWNKLWKDPVGITWVFAFKKYNPVVLKCPPSFFVICIIRAYRVQNLTPEESKYKCVMPKQLQPFPSNISCDAFSAWSKVPRFPPISLHLFFSLALMWFICGWRTLDQLIIIPLQSCRQLQIRLCRSPICNWQRHSASLSILCPLTSAPAWNGKLGVCWAAIRSVDWLLQCSALPRLLYCRLVSWMKSRLICRYCNQSDQLMATFQSHSRGFCRD